MMHLIVFASRTRALGERLQLLQQPTGLDGWPPPNVGLADANQLLVRLCNVTDEQLVPPPGVTFDRCLEGEHTS